MPGESGCGSEKVVRGYFSGKVTFEQGLDGDTVWHYLGDECCSENSKCEGPEVGACLAYPRTTKEVMRWDKYCGGWGDADYRVPGPLVGLWLVLWAGSPWRFWEEGHDLPSVWLAPPSYMENRWQGRDCSLVGDRGPGEAMLAWGEEVRSWTYLKIEPVWHAVTQTWECERTSEQCRPLTDVYLLNFKNQFTTFI